MGKVLNFAGGAPSRATSTENKGGGLLLVLRRTPVHDERAIAVVAPLARWPRLRARVLLLISTFFREDRITIEDAGLLVDLLELTLLAQHLRDPTEAEFRDATKEYRSVGKENYTDLVSAKRNPRSREEYLKILVSPVRSEIERAWSRRGKAFDLGWPEWRTIEVVLILLWGLLERQLPDHQLRPRPFFMIRD